MLVTMASITFDRQELVRELKISGLPQEQAEAIVRTIVKSHAELATKSDIDTRLAETKLELIKWIVGLILGKPHCCSLSCQKSSGTKPITAVQLAMRSAESYA